MQNEELSAALFLDFDNIFIGLRNISPEAATAFVRNIQTWLEWFRAGQHSQGDPIPRRLLVQRCYLEPGSAWSASRSLRARRVRDSRLPGVDFSKQELGRHLHGAGYHRSSGPSGSHRRVYRAVGRCRFHACAASSATSRPHRDCIRKSGHSGGLQERFERADRSGSFHRRGLRAWFGNGLAAARGCPAGTYRRSGSRGRLRCAMHHGGVAWRASSATQILWAAF